ncbi:MAG: glycosyltransferase family 4 protein [Gammaproteobacteria bacterium]|nr:MAG: glycosyltransferase family 4 protein [Gammaproteobacteria bacterium]
MTILLISLICFITSVFLTWIIRIYALKKKIVDIPNSRSSHIIPTPRGGGLSFIIAFIAALIFLLASNLVDKNLAIALLASGGIVAIVGLIDDHNNLKPKIRITAHFIAASIGVYCLGGLPALTFFGKTTDLGIIGDLLAIIGTVWILNLNNFMDGIDGISSIEAISVALFLSLLIFHFGQHKEVIDPLIILAFAVAGFLVWNFPPAKIFMGDSGSGFLGITLALIGIKSANIDQNFFWITLVLIGVFMVDATYTLIVRIKNGEKASEAHRSHAYQFASRKYGHRAVTLSVFVINAAWLAPISWSIAAGNIDGAVGMVAAYLPLTLLAFKFNAGKRE